MSNVDLVQRIDDFWRWWNTAKDALAQAITARTLDEWVEPISDHVAAIDAGLAWELGPGAKSEHHICVSAEGDSALRVTAQRWLARAPAADETWEYYPARQASAALGDPKLTLRLEEVDVVYEDFRVRMQLDQARRTIHVTAFHPKLRDLPERSRSMAVFLFLDDLLGEDGVERWIGRVAIALDPPEAAAPRQALRDAVRVLAEKGSDSFVLLEDSRDGKRWLATMNLGLKRLDHLLMDSHIEIAIAYPTDREDGLYRGTIGEDLGTMEDDLLERLGNDAVYIGHETFAGRRTIHLHVDATGPAAARIAEWERTLPTWDIEVAAKRDPSWEILHRF